MVELSMKNRTDKENIPHIYRIDLERIFNAYSTFKAFDYNKRKIVLTSDLPELT